MLCSEAGKCGITTVSPVDTVLVDGHLCEEDKSEMKRTIFVERGYTGPEILELNTFC